MAKAKRRIGLPGRVVFGVLGLGLTVLTFAIWLKYLVNPARAAMQGTKTTVTVTRCEGGGLDRTCFASWSGGSGRVDGHPPPGSRVQAYVRGGRAYQATLASWYPRLVLGLVGVGAGGLGQYLLLAALRSRK